MTFEDRVLNAALAYAEIGWRVFPVKKRGKAPALGNWQRIATTDAEQITEWFTNRYRGCNLGIATGIESGLVVIDVDGPEGRATMKEKGYLARTPSVRTSNGLHLYFRHPGGKIGNKVRLMNEVDSRADGGLVVVPPSIHPDGQEYEWEIEPGEDDVWPAALPGSLSILLTQSGHHDTRAARLAADGEMIEEGFRNDTLFREGCRLRSNNYTEIEIRDALQSINMQRCDPPMPIEEVEQIAQQAAKYPPGKAGTLSKQLGEMLDIVRTVPDEEFYADEQAWELVELDPDQVELFVKTTTTDERLADRFAMLFGNYFRFNVNTGTWLTWAGGHWEPTTPGKVYRAVASLGKIARRLFPKVSDDDEKTTLFRVIKATENVSHQGTIIQAAQHRAAFETEARMLDQNDGLLATTNETIDLRTGRARPSYQEDLITRHVAVGYDADAKAPRWEAFVNEVMSGDKERAEYLQKAVGYSLTGETVEQCMFILVGAGANGKSTFLKVVQEMMGSYAATVGFDMLDVNAKSDANPVMASLQGVRFVSASEAEDDRVLAVARVKRITGGDPVMARHLYQAPFTYYPRFKVWLAVNQMPIVRSPDVAIKRRLQVIEFHENFMDYRHDPYIEGKLLAELPGILNWALEGLRRWNKEGLKPPASIANATEAHMTSTNPIALWLEEECEIDEAASMLSGDAYREFSYWADGNGYRKRTSNSFGRGVTAMGFDRFKQAGQWNYRGFKLRETGLAASVVIEHLDQGNTETDF